MKKFNLNLILKFIKEIKNPVYPLLDFLFPNLIKKEYLIKIKNGPKFWIRPKRGSIVGDIDILIEIFIENQYNLSEILRPDYNVLDIGGQAGFFSIFASRIIGSKGRVYTFEPFESNFNQLMKNMKLNKMGNIIAYDKAIVGGLETRADLFISHQNVGAHSLLNRKDAKKIKVESTNLRKFFTEKKIRKIDLLKIDCEGGEYEILSKTPKDILKKIDTIILEQHITSYTKKYSENFIINFLKSNSFSVKILKEIYYEKEGKFYIILAQKINNKENGPNSIRTRNSPNS